MTVTYTKKVTTTGFCGFSKLLLRWRGSVFKLLWPDLFVYFLLYFLVSGLYRFVLQENEKRLFEKIAISCEYFRNVFPISFVLGFYVSIVVQRWWEQYMLIPWPDTVCILASAYIQGQDERGHLLRRSFARYINLAFALAFARISPRVSRRFPSYQHYIDQGYMTDTERVIFEMMDGHSSHHKIWMPLVWAALIVRQARQEGRCPDDHGQKAVINEITNLRYNCGKLQEYHTMSVPLVYTQVVTLATYSYFGFAIIGRQFLDPDQGYADHSVDFYIPIFTFLQFVFYMGWLKVAESLLNPFGDDDDDFDTLDFLERHLEVSYMIVDEMHKIYPEVLQNNNGKDNLPYPHQDSPHYTTTTTPTENHHNSTVKQNKKDSTSPIIKHSRNCTNQQDLCPPQHGPRPPSPTRTSRSSCTPRYSQVSVILEGARHTATRLAFLPALATPRIPPSPTKTRENFPPSPPKARPNFPPSPPKVRSNFPPSPTKTRSNFLPGLAQCKPTLSSSNSAHSRSNFPPSPIKSRPSFPPTLTKSRSNFSPTSSQNRGNFQSVSTHLRSNFAPSSTQTHSRSPPPQSSPTSELLHRKQDRNSSARSRIHLK